uniref:SFRICE_020632 n=1 Tax=Spodoptera frugiperda TaxID=7108 RepID=A0A2H1X0D1_SPOFR
MEGAFVLPRFTIGIIEESMTLKRDIPYTRSLGSTTAFSSHEGPILHVPTGWYVVDVSCRSSALLTRVSVPLGKTTRIPLKVTWSCKFSPTARSFLTGMCNCSKCSRGPTPDNMSNFGELILPALTMTSFLAYAVCTLPFRVYLTPYATFCLFISTLVTSASDLTVKFFLLYLIGCMKALFVDTRTPSFDVDCEYIVVSLWAPLKSPRGTPPSTNALTIIMAGLSMLGASQNKSAGVLRDVAHIVIAPPVVAEVCPFVVVLLAAADNSGKSARPFLILEPVYYLGHPQDCPGRARQLLPSQSVSDDTPCGPGAYHYEVILLSRCHLIIVAVSSASLDPLVVRPSVELHHEVQEHEPEGRAR